MMRPRVALALQSRPARKRLTSYLERATEVWEVSAGSFKELLLEVLREEPDVMVVELSPDSPFTRDLVLTVRSALPRTWLVVYSPRPSAVDARLLEAGVHYYSPGRSVADLRRAVAAAIRGRQRLPDGASIRMTW